MMRSIINVVVSLDLFVDEIPKNPVRIFTLNYPISSFVYAFVNTYEPKLYNMHLFVQICLTKCYYWQECSHGITLSSPDVGPTICSLKLGVYDADLNQAVKLKQHMTAAGPSSFLLPQYKTLIEIARSAREASRPISAPVDVVTVDDEEHNTVCCKCIIK